MLVVLERCRELVMGAAVQTLRRVIPNAESHVHRPPTTCCQYGHSTSR